MKRPYQRIVTIILSCVMIAVSVIGTTAAHTERTNYVDTLHNTRFGAGNINCAPSNSNRETDLHQILRQLGCPEELCQKVLNQLGSYRWYSIADCNRSQNCSPQPEPTAPTEKVIPTEAPTQLPKPTPTTAPSEQATQTPTEVATEQTTEHSQPSTEAPNQPATEAPAPTQIPTE